MTLKERLEVQAMFEGLRYCHNRVICSGRTTAQPQAVVRTIKQFRENVWINVVQRWDIDTGWKDVTNNADLTMMVAK